MKSRSEPRATPNKDTETATSYRSVDIILYDHTIDNVTQNPTELAKMLSENDYLFHL